MSADLNNNGSNAFGGRQRYTLRHVLHAASTERNFNYGFWLNILLDILVEGAIRYFGYLLVCVASFLIGAVSIFGFLIVLPEITYGNSIWFHFNLFWGLF